jgi:succinate dehydrogenase / fumarate reductase membrane anchor subunit
VGHRTVASLIAVRTPLSRVLNHGSAHSGAEHFWRQRVTAAANAVLTPAFVIIVLATLGRPHAEAAAILGSPPVAAILALLVVSATVHMRIGMQVIIEDYVHGERARVLALLANTFFAAAIAAVALIAILRLAVGA